MFVLDKEKYLQLAKSNGHSAALTQLHRDFQKWEHGAFEGRKGFDPKAVESLKEVHKFSREIWDYVTEDKMP